MLQAKKNVVNLSLKLRYGVGDLGMSMLTAFLQFYLLFYCTEAVKINPAIAGTAILVGKLTWDMINDGLCGYITDKTKSRWGRRRPYLFFCAAPLALGFWALLSLPVGMSDVAAFFALVGVFMLFDTFHTMITVSYYAMNAELTMDYNERTSLATARMLFNVVGYLLGAAVTPFFAGFLEKSGFSTSQAYSIIGLCFGVVAAITVLITALTVTEKPVCKEESTQYPAFKSIIISFKSKPFRMYTVIVCIMSIAFTVVTTMLPYFIKYQVHMDDGLNDMLIMAAMLVVLAIFLVPCRILSDKVGKGRAYAYGLIIASVALIAGFFLPNHPTWLIYLVAVICGIGFSSQWVCPHSMMPDLAEYDEAITGERREGVLYGLSTMTTKITGAFGSAICGWGLALFGYVSVTSGEPTIDPILTPIGIRIMFCLIPAVLLLICVPLLIQYPVTREGHAKLVKELELVRANKLQAQLAATQPAQEDKTEELNARQDNQEVDSLEESSGKQDNQEVDSKDVDVK